MHNNEEVLSGATIGAFIGAMAYFAIHLIPMPGYKHVLDFVLRSIFILLNGGPHTDKTPLSPENLLAAAVYIAGWGISVVIGATVGAIAVIIIFRIKHDG